VRDPVRRRQVPWTAAAVWDVRLGTGAKGVLVRWRTGTEIDLLGFQVYRAHGHSWKRITRSLIAAKGSVSGPRTASSTRRRGRGVSYGYPIKAVNRDGTMAWFGPVRVT
jgi:hypothetical protein